MTYVIINALLYVILWIVYWYRRKTIDCGFLLIGVWATIAIMGVFLYMDNPSRWDISLWPFIYLFVGFLIYSKMFIFPSSKLDNSIELFVYKKNKALDVMCAIFILCALFNLLNSDLSSMTLSMEEIEKAAVDNYNLHADNIGNKAYSNFIERFSLNYFAWFKVAAVIGAYNLFCQRRVQFATVLSLCIIIPSFFNCLMIGSRSALFTDVMLYLSGYVLYREYIPHKTKKNLNIIAAFAGAIALLFLIGFTNSRFSDSEMGSGGSLVFYFGQPMLCFNDGIANSVDGYLYGARTFKTILSWFGMSLPDYTSLDDLLGTNFGTNFTTIIGMLVLDFGFIGTLLFGLVLSSVFQRLCMYKKSFTVASLFLYLFFLNRLIFGVFTNKSGADMFYIIAFGFYLFFRFVFEGKFNINNKNIQVHNRYI